MIVLCILPTRDRGDMTARAVRSFQSQSYAKKRLMILHNGDAQDHICGFDGDKRINQAWCGPGLTIGELRNKAIELDSFGQPELIAHFDSDDWSHPERLSEQVALIEQGYDIVGYRDLLFYDSISIAANTGRSSGELHLYSAGRSNNHIGCGTSFMYRRSAWERHPFHAVTNQEDMAFLNRIPLEKRMFVSSLEGPQGQHREPRMIAEIHGANTMRHRKMEAPHWQQIVDEPLIADVRKWLGYA